MAKDDLDSSPGTSPAIEVEPKPSVIHNETHLAPRTGWKVSKTGDGDTAMALFENPQDLDDILDPEEEKKLVRKIDFMILPYLMVCYCFFYIDKTTLSYAAIFGIRKDLNLQGTQYSWLSGIFYFGFLAWALPTNLLLQRFPVGKYLGTQIMLWGFFLMLQAACNSFQTLAVCRFLAGAAESAADPSFMIITQMWYTRRQQPVKIGIWFAAQGLGTATGGLLGYAIGHIRGSLPSWKYEFVIIGALCFVWGIVMFFFLPDSPVNARGLSLKERRQAVERLRDNQTGVENKHFKLYQVKDLLRDVKTYVFFLMALVASTPNGGISNFGTLIINGFGYSTLVTTVLQVPYGAFISLWVLGIVFLNDRFKNKRCLFIIISMFPNIAGTFGLRYISDEHRVAKLMCYYLTAPYNGMWTLTLSLATANTAGHTKKVLTNAIFFLGYCTGGIAGPFFYKTTQAPTYSLGIWSMIVSHLLSCVSTGLFWMIMKRENKRRDVGQGIIPGAVDVRDIDSTAFSDMTDRENPNFRYIY